jgi:polyphosphate glucokinase
VRVLAIDVGGSSVKMMVSGDSESRQFDSGPDLTPAEFVADVRRHTEDWTYDVVALGDPGAVDVSGPAAEPGNLGSGWVRFDFEREFGKPVRVVNDAVMQALGGYHGGRMLFLGLGTGLGSSLVTEHVVIPLELGCLPYRDGMVVDFVGRPGLERLGDHEWQQVVHEIVGILRKAFAADYVLLGGGNAERLERRPEGAERGGNDDAFVGGFRLWEEVVEPHDQKPSPAWRVVR